MPSLQSLVNLFSGERPAWMRSGSALNMPERFNRASRMVSFVAHEHARSGGQNGVHTDHLLLALSEDSSVRPMLKSAGVDIERLKTTILSFQKRDSVSCARDGVLPRSSVVHLAWQIAHDVADEDSALHIAPRHLFIATVRALRTFGNDAILSVLGPSIGSK